MGVTEVAFIHPDHRSSVTKLLNDHFHEKLDGPLVEPTAAISTTTNGIITTLTETWTRLTKKQRSGLRGYTRLSRNLRRLKLRKKQRRQFRAVHNLVNRNNLMHMDFM